MNRADVSQPPYWRERRLPRVQVAWHAELAADDGRRMAVKVVDVSLAGLGIVGDDRLQPHQTVLVQATVPDLPDMSTQSTVQFRAKVAHQSLQRGVWRGGLQLDDLTPEQETLLKAWLARQSGPW